MTSSNGNIFRVTGPLCGEFTGSGEFPTQRPVTRSFDVFFDLRLNKRLSKQPWGWWFETLSWSLWRQCNAIRLRILWVWVSTLVCAITVYLRLILWLIYSIQYNDMTSLMISHPTIPKSIVACKTLATNIFQTKLLAMEWLQNHILPVVTGTWVLASKSFWKNSRVVGDVRCQDTHVTSL